MPALPRFRCLRLVVAVAVAFAAPPTQAQTHKSICGTSRSGPPTYSFGEPGDFVELTRKVRITMRDMSLEPAVLTMKTGETVRFVITNASAIDHDFTLGDEATQLEHRREMAAMTDIPAAHRIHRDAHAMFVPAGETRVLIWTFSRPVTSKRACGGASW